MVWIFCLCKPLYFRTVRKGSGISLPAGVYYRPGILQQPVQDSHKRVQGFSKIPSEGSCKNCEGTCGYLPRVRKRSHDVFGGSLDWHRTLPGGISDPWHRCGGRLCGKWIYSAVNQRYQRSKVHRGKAAALSLPRYLL